MRIAWFTPFSTDSAIGKCSSLILPHLSREAEVDVWHPATAHPILAGFRTIRFDSAASVDIGRLKKYDLLVYNIGNHLPFHKDICLLSQEHPGVTILHDFVMQHFFAAYYLEELRSTDAYCDLMQRHYGEAGWQIARDVVERGRNLWNSPDVLDFPLFEEAIGKSLGIIVHSEFFRRRVEKAFAGPVAKLSLLANWAPSTSPIERSKLSIPNDRLLVVSGGHVNPNRRIHAVLEVLARNPSLARRIVYFVIGQQEPGYMARLRSLVEKEGLQHCVRFLGHAPDEEFHSYLAHAAIFVNLRFPPTEGASGSAIEQMLCGRPSIVTDTGFYSEIPDECVWKIPPGREAPELERALTSLIENPELRELIGSRAKEYAQREFRADRYAEDFVVFAREVVSVAPILRLTDRIADELSIIGATAAMPILSTAATDCHKLFCPEQLENSPSAPPQEKSSKSLSG